MIVVRASIQKDGECVIDSLEKQLEKQFGDKLAPVRSSLKNRNKCMKLAKEEEAKFKIKGGCYNTERIIREKLGSK